MHRTLKSSIAGLLCGLSAYAPVTAAGTLSLTIPGGSYAVEVESFRELRFHGVIRQQYDFSCGAAALASLLSYHYDHPVGEQPVFAAMFEHGDQARIRTDRFSLLDMKRYLETLGLAADGFRISLELREVGAPAIALIDTDGFNRDSEWAARPRAPLGEAISRAELASFTLALPRPGGS
jgi:predicted double-glycine peptidase